MTEPTRFDGRIDPEAIDKEIEFLEKARELGLTQHSDMAKWLIASLLAINSGGAVSAVNAIDKLDIVLPAIFFTTGLILALMIAVTNQRANTLTLKPINETIGYWIAVKEDRLRSEEYEQLLRKGLRPATRVGFMSVALGWLSAFSFIAGAVSLSDARPKGNGPLSATCAALERDIIARRPGRTESREDFVALGCKPEPSAARALERSSDRTRGAPKRGS